MAAVRANFGDSNRRQRSSPIVGNRYQAFTLNRSCCPMAPSSCYSPFREHIVRLRGSSSGASQNDVFALVRVGISTFAITIEGKVNEPFGEQVRDWLHSASDRKRERPPVLWRTSSGWANRFKTIRTLSVAAADRFGCRRSSLQQFKTDRCGNDRYIHSLSDKMRIRCVRATCLPAHSARKRHQIELIATVTRSPIPRRQSSVFIGWATGDPKFLTV